MPTKTLTEALAEGYTHFCIGIPAEEEFEVYELAEGNLQAIKGVPAFLCGRDPMSVAIRTEDLAGMICDAVGLGDTLMSPAVIKDMENKLKDSEALKKATEIINKELGEYKTYGDTDILVTLD